jgi:hypothetical protein
MIWLEAAGLLVAALAFALWLRGHLRLRRTILPGMTCPECGGQRWLRVHRRSGDRFFGLGFGFRRYRCLDCQYEGLRKRND